MTPAAKGNSRQKIVIHNQIDAFLTAWNNHNPQAMAMICAENADLINSFGRIAKSRAEIEVLFVEEHAGWVKDSCMSLMFEGLRLLTPDVAVSDHAFELSGVRDRSGKESTLRGHLTLVFQKHEDTWQIAACRPMVPAPRPKLK
jgi:uncharacterized protein (TIGR02246 family)